MKSIIKNINKSFISTINKIDRSKPVTDFNNLPKNKVRIVNSHEIFQGKKKKKEAILNKDIKLKKDKIKLPNFVKIGPKNGYRSNGMFKHIVETEKAIDDNIKQQKENDIKDKDEFKDFFGLYKIEQNKKPPIDLNLYIDKSKFIHNNVQFFKHKTDFDKESNKKINPVSPKLGPFEVKNPDAENKSFHWCSCGLSKSQPFCDRSHKGTKMKPINFKLGEHTDKILLCGCKYSTEAPFCDKKTCLEMLNTDDIIAKEKIRLLSDIKVDVNEDSIDHNNNNSEEVSNKI